MEAKCSNFTVIKEKTLLALLLLNEALNEIQENASSIH